MNRELAAETEAKKQPILSCDVYGVEGLFLSWWWSSVYIVFRLQGAGFALVFGFLGLVVSIGLYPRTLESAAPTRSGSGRGGPSSRTMPSIARVSECSRSSPMSISIVASVSYSDLHLCPSRSSRLSRIRSTARHSSGTSIRRLHAICWLCLRGGFGG